MWLVVVRWFDIIQDSSASVCKAKEGEDIAYTMGGLKGLVHVYPFATKKKAEFYAAEYNKNHR